MMSWGHLSKDFFDLVKSIGESRSKQEEDRIIVRETSVLKQKINGPNIAPKKMKEYLIRALYIEMLGHDASFAYVSAVKLTCEKNLHCKKVGYLICSLCLHKDHELMLLLINTIQRDLMSANHLEVASALTCVCRLVNSEMVPAVFPQIMKLLSHKNENVRKKACMAIQKLHSVQPDLLEQAGEGIRRALCDPDPSVMGATLHVLHDVARINSYFCKDLVPSLVSILKQITEHRLQKEYDYHRVPAPWLQIKLLALLATIGKGNQELSEQIYEVLGDVIRRADTGVNVSYAIIYEAVKTVTTLYPSHTLLEAAASSISRFISAENHNLKYVGVTGLAGIVQINPAYAAQHQLTVVDCLEDTDETLKRKTLDLLFRMTNPQNVTVVTDKMLHHLKESQDLHMRSDLVHKITKIAEQYAPSDLWYLDTMRSLFEVGGGLVNEKTAYNLLTLIAEGPSGDEEQDEKFRMYAVKKFSELMEEQKHHDDLVIQVTSWVIGEYGNLCDGISIEDTIDLLVDAADSPSLTETTRGWIVSALTKLIGRNPSEFNDTARDFVQRHKSNPSAQVQQRCYELLGLLKDPDIMRRVLPYDASCEDVEVDPSLQFLDDFVEHALAEGARPYDPETSSKARSHAAPAHVQNKGVAQGINFTPYAQPEIPQPGLTATPADPSRDQKGSVAGSEIADVLSGHAQASSEPTLTISGPRKWGPAGYNDNKAKPSQHANVASPQQQSTGQVESIAPAPSQAPLAQPATSKPEESTKPREPTEREKMAAALFGGLAAGPTAATTGSVGAPPSSGSPTGPSPTAGGVARLNRATGSGFFKPQNSSQQKAQTNTLTSTPPASTSPDLNEVDLLGNSRPPSAQEGPREGGTEDLLDLDECATSRPTSGGGGHGAGGNSRTVSPSPHKYDGPDLFSLDQPTPQSDMSRSTEDAPPAGAGMMITSLGWDTQQVGSTWGSLSSERKKNVAPMPFLSTCSAVMDKISARVGFQTVDIVGTEGLGAGRKTGGVGNGTTVLLHTRVEGPSVAITIKAADNECAEECLAACGRALQG